jgi:hypothetical protein
MLTAGVTAPPPTIAAADAVPPAWVEERLAVLDPAAGDLSAWQVGVAGTETDADGPDDGDEPVFFDVTLDDGRVAHCWRAACQPYQNCVFSSGLVSGIDPDTVYVRLAKEGHAPTTIFLRPDEAQALAWLINGTLWSQAMLDKDGETQTP